MHFPNTAILWARPRTRCRYALYSIYLPNSGEKGMIFKGVLFLNHGRACKYYYWLVYAAKYSSKNVASQSDHRFHGTLHQSLNRTNDERARSGIDGSLCTRPWSYDFGVSWITSRTKERCNG